MSLFYTKLKLNYLTNSNEVIACFPGNFLQAPTDFASSLVLTGSLSMPRAILYSQNLREIIIDYIRRNLIEKKFLHKKMIYLLQINMPSINNYLSLTYQSLSANLIHINRKNYYTYPVFSSNCFCNCSKEYCNKSPMTLHPRDLMMISPNFPPRFRTFFTGSVE